MILFESMLKKFICFIPMALVVTSVSAATDYIDLLGDITIEDELAQAVELREARSRVVMPEDSVWETIRKGFALNDLPETVVDAELRRYTQALNYTQSMALRARMYL